MKVEIIKMVEVPVVIEAEIIPGEEATHDYPGCSPEAIGLEPRIVAEDVFKHIHDYLDSDKDEIQNDLIAKAEDLKEYDRQL